MSDNLLLNRVERGVCIHQLGLSSGMAETATLAYGTGTTLQTDKHPDDAPSTGDSDRVRLTTVDIFVARHVTPHNHRVAVVKLDIEGFAGQALKGATALVNSRQVKVWFIGIHNDNEKNDATAVLEGAGYVVRPVLKGAANPNDAIVATLPE